eukprot:TRINITY_DN26719_c0_g1_i1.p1 TRINITY_DN26719_c0_g1~~TRINITY_DN26719_c0_g1_i1.p1  ORF type:complete len:292 (+),score=87.34 TRINITY_DN26719_c0_g1_i1:56-877(+)
MTELLSILEDFLYNRNHKYMRLDGTTSSERREELLKEFNQPDSDYFVFLLSTRAGGLGLNLQTADTVIIFDSDWNPHADLQASDRAHRIGQKNEVRVLRMVTASPVEELILARASGKLDLDQKVIQAGMFNVTSTAMDRKNFLEEILKKASISDMPDDIPDDEEINNLIARDDREFEIFQEMDQERAERRERDWLINGGLGSCPPSLMPDDELPRWLEEAIKIEAAKPKEEVVQYGRGQRNKGPRKRLQPDNELYSEEEEDEEWLQSHENDAD